MKQTSDRYHSLSITIHWLTTFVLVLVYASIFLREIFPKGSELRDGLKMWHFTFGAIVFLLLLIRLPLPFLFPPPPILPPPPRWQKFLASSMHFAIYLFLFIMPLLGWLALSAKGKSVLFFGLSIPGPLAINKALAHQLEDWHETIGIIGLYLIGMHTLAALFHHYILRDNALIRMLPRLRRKS